ncbi:MAG: NAD(P)H-dependent oxidoreductase [Methylocystaceae bacterium]|nr:NAD(P)H-dependent oxidoreductase [Methylocystaceae bacterium]
MKVIAFGASNSRQSINKQLATSAAQMINGAEVEILDLNDFEMPLFSVDREKDIGQHPLAKTFREKIASADFLIISFAEHNGHYSIAYKNLFDWCSRIDRNVYQDKPSLILATSPGERGGKSVLELALNQLPNFGCKIKASLSVPSFYDIFDPDTLSLKPGEVANQLHDAIQQLIG